MFKRILAIGAHPDDVEFSCFGYLSKMRDEGATIKVFIASAGCMGDPTSGKQRISESIESFCEFDTHTVIARSQVGLPEGIYEELSTEIRNLILDFEPDLILTHHHADSHQEHRLLREITLTAARRIRCSIFAYKSVSVLSDFGEGVYVNVSKYLEDKKKALSKHYSQAGRDYMSEARINDYHKNWFGVMHGLADVEVYTVIRLLV